MSVGVPRRRRSASAAARALARASSSPRRRAAAAGSRIRSRNAAWSKSSGGASGAFECRPGLGRGRFRDGRFGGRLRSGPPSGSALSASGSSPISRSVKNSSSFPSEKGRSFWNPVFGAAICAFGMTMAGGGGEASSPTGASSGGGSAGSGSGAGSGRGNGLHGRLRERGRLEGVEERILLGRGGEGAVFGPGGDEAAQQHEEEKQVERRRDSGARHPPTPGVADKGFHRAPAAQAGERSGRHPPGRFPGAAGAVPAPEREARSRAARGGAPAAAAPPGGRDSECRNSCARGRAPVGPVGPIVGQDASEMQRGPWTARWPSTAAAGLETVDPALGPRVERGELEGVAGADPAAETHRRRHQEGPAALRCRMAGREEAAGAFRERFHHENARNHRRRREVSGEEGSSAGTRRRAVIRRDPLRRVPRSRRGGARRSSSFPARRGPAPVGQPVGKAPRFAALRAALLHLETPATGGYGSLCPSFSALKRVMDLARDVEHGVHDEGESGRNAEDELDVAFDSDLFDNRSEFLLQGLEPGGLLVVELPLLILEPALQVGLLPLDVAGQVGARLLGEQLRAGAVREVADLLLAGPAGRAGSLPASPGVR